MKDGPLLTRWKEWWYSSTPNRIVNKLSYEEFGLECTKCGKSLRNHVPAYGINVAGRFNMKPKDRHLWCVEGKKDEFCEIDEFTLIVMEGRQESE
jgi:hypothetical protein